MLSWQWIKSYRLQLMAVGFWLFLLLTVRQYMMANDLDFSDFAKQLRAVLTQSSLGPLLFIGIYLLRPITLFPALLLTILGGSIFGVWPGFVYVLVAGTLSSIIPYSVGRWFSSAQPKSFSDNQILHRSIGTLKRHPFQSMLIIRLLFLPYDGISLMAGGLRIPFSAFFLATLLGNISGSFSYVGLGASVQGDITTGDLSLDPATLLLSLVILAVSLLFSRMLNIYQNRRRLALQEDME